MALTTYQAFEQFMADITITEYQKTSIVEGRRRSAIENLTAAFPSRRQRPGPQSGPLSGYRSYNARTEVQQSFEAAAERAAKAIAAEASGDHEEAKRLWRIILGASFPS